MSPRILPDTGQHAPQPGARIRAREMLDVLAECSSAMLIVAIVNVLMKTIESAKADER